MSEGQAAGAGGVGEAAALWEEIRTRPYTHPQIPYVALAGCGGGARAFPRHPVMANALDFGADPSGAADSAPAINRALREVGESGGGTVLLPPGTYRVDDVILVGWSHTTLRGAGSDRTTLRATASLTDLVGRYGSRYGGDKSSWSWAGGLVWMCPADRHRALTTAIRAAAWPFEGWTGNLRDEAVELARVTELSPQGGWQATLDDVSRVRAGDRVLVQYGERYGAGPAAAAGCDALLAHIAGDIPGAAAYDWADKTKLVSYLPYEWPAVITAVDPAHHRVTFDRPLPLATRPAFRPRLTTLAAPLLDAGVEGLTIRTDAPAEQSPHLLDRGWNGLVAQCTWDCWVDDVHAVDVDNGFLMVAAKATTFRRTRVSGRGCHHGWVCREGSHDNLVEDFTLDARTTPAPAGTQLHGINAEGLSSYNVWSRGRMAMGTFDTHRGMPFANVRTEITLVNDGQHGGDLSAGPLYGARFTHWNVTVANARAGCVRIDDVAPRSATVGVSEVRPFAQVDEPDFTGPLGSRLAAYGAPGAVEPPNLYEAQRALL
ncbi:glycosyl hydrolase family 28-related protein [Streptomyces sp. NPDC021020]|uniref:glycosyl hydrolase family 28-related protein n=1 Tax=Streptomyces sp. NPDC021020 TaxID=3365109 RepID=UPI0037876261